MTRIILTLAALLVAWTATAQQTVTYHRVSGVAAGDTLSIRSGPSATSDKVGELAPGAAPIEITALNDAGTWGRMAFYEGDGWVSMRFLEPHDVAMLTETGSGRPAGLPIGLWCGGTEPFWGFQVTDPRTVRFDDPNADGPLMLEIRRVQIAVGFREMPAGIRAGAPSGATLDASFRHATCTDGMSDTTFGMTTEIWFDPDGSGPGLLSGCCRLALPE